MIVSLGSQSIANGGSGTYQYNCQSLQKIYVQTTGQTGGSAHSFKVTVQIGNRTICNNVDAWALQQINATQTGGVNSDVSAATGCMFAINLGSHIVGSETIYVTVASSTGATKIYQVGALVNEPVPSMPLRLTEFSDSSFASENVLQAYVYSRGNILTSTATIEVRNATFSTTAPISMYVIANSSDGFIDQTDFESLGKLMSSSLPLDTTFNNSSSNNIVCVNAMPNSPQQRSVAQRQASAIKASLSPSERRAL